MKAKAILCTFLFLGFMYKASSQHTYANWSKHFNGNEQNAFNNILFDGQALVVNGYWFLAAEFEGIALPDSLSSNALIAKTDLEGNIIWHSTMVGDGYETFFDMAFDSESNIVAVGWSSSNGPIAINDEIVYVPNMEWTARGVVAKFSGVDGSLIWYKPILPSEEYYNMSVNKVTVDANDNIFITGYSNTGFEIDGISFPYSQVGWGSQTFIAKLNSDGLGLWGQHFDFIEEGDAGWSAPKAITIIGDNVFLAVQYSKPILINETSLPYQGEGFYDWIALAKLSTETLEFTSVNAYGGSLDQNIATLKHDNNGNLIAVGYFDSGSDFSINGNVPISYGEQDAYVAKFNNNLEIEWLRSMGSEYVTRAFNLSITDDNRIFIGGGFDSYTPFYFQGHEVIKIQSPNSLGMFQVVIDSDGEFEKAFALYGQGINSRVEYRDAAILNNDIVMAVGTSIDYVNFTEGNTFYSDHDAGFFMQWDLSQTFYKIQFNIKDQNGNPLENAVITLGNTINTWGSYEFYQLEPGSYPYTVTLEGYNAVEGEVEILNQNETVTITLTQNGTSISNNPSILVSLFPNPSNMFVSITSASEIESVRITNALGRTIYNQKVGANSSKINVADLHSGIYIVFVETKNGVISRKLQVAK